MSPTCYTNRMSKKSNKRPKRGRGRPKFQPTDEHRRFVALMSGFKLTWAEQAKVLGISKTTLRLRFKRELADGAAKLKAMAVSRFYDALAESAPWAIQMAMRNWLSWDRSGYGGAAIEPPDESDAPQPPMIEFVVPGYHEGEGAPEPPPPTPPPPAPRPWQRQIEGPRPDDLPMVQDAAGIYRPAPPRTELDEPRRPGHRGTPHSAWPEKSSGQDWMK